MRAPRTSTSSNCVTICPLPLVTVSMSRRCTRLRRTMDISDGVCRAKRSWSSANFSMSDVCGKGSASMMVQSSYQFGTANDDYLISHMLPEKQALQYVSND
ncbi:protein of unknown function (plasmid) [Caballeronia sp. S22]